MVKNIIFDVGGVILDDSLDNISKVYGKDMSEVYKKVFSGDFRKCLLGELSANDYIKTFENDKDYKYVSEILDPSKQNTMCPLMKDNYDYICNLKSKGYHLYLLSNITKESLEYLKSIIDIDKYFDGVVFSCEVGIKKPDRAIFELIINKYNLDLNETVYYDDKDRMINAALDYGLEARQFNSIEDIKENK